MASMPYENEHQQELAEPTVLTHWGNPEAYKPDMVLEGQIQVEAIDRPRGKILTNPVGPSLTARRLAVTDQPSVQTH